MFRFRKKTFKMISTYLNLQITCGCLGMGEVQWEKFDVLERYQCITCLFKLIHILKENSQIKNDGTC